ncbi:putative Ig domain-containing protein [Synechocystis salina LEGE 06099]|uniref:Calx-beta domain-containing protein n=1 Tax=Synechocystis salina TaxID=945780 RepID=UPI0018817A3E|nr:Calx-beta domain-containing protein [Synechocystis salina]MBE9204811.1 putative Ig domain-containing protein [Synechocystis salina LEGE 06099]
MEFPAGAFITATATDANNNTSEFSQGLVVSQNSAPTDLNLSNTSVNENVGLYQEIGIFSTTDPNTGDSFIYELVNGEGDTDNNAFLIADYFSDGQIRLVNNDFINYEQKDSYSIRVRTTDQNGASYEKILTITVNDLDDPVVISGPSWDNPQIIEEDPIYPGLVFSSANGNAITLSDEDANADQATYTINWDVMDTGFGLGGGYFSLGQFLPNNQGTLSEINAALESSYFTPNLDFNGNVTLSIYINDDQGNPIGGISPGVYLSVPIQVTPVNDAPELMLGFSSLDWNEGSQYQEFFYGSDVDNYDGSGSYTELTYSAQLNNGNPLPDWLTFSSGSFNGTLIGTPPPGSAGSLEIAVTVSDGELSDTEIFTLNIISTNTDPIITSGNTATFAENKTGVVYTVAATDSDGDLLTYSLGGTDASLFTINSNTGEISFLTAPDFENPLDAGGNNVYDITVIANDGTVDSSPQAVAITVTDQAVFTINDVIVNENAGNATFTVTMTDPLASGTATVNYATANGTAFATPYDYTATSGTLTFNAGDTSKTIQVAINDDLFYEPTNETFFVNLSSPSSNATISKAQGIGTIIDNDTL